MLLRHQLAFNLSWVSFKTQFCKITGNCKLQFLLKHKCNLSLGWFILSCLIINDHCLDCSEGEDLLKQIWICYFKICFIIQRKKPNFLWDISVCIDFDRDNPILVPIPSPFKNGLIFVDAVNSHWAEETGWSKRAEAVKC